MRAWMGCRRKSPCSDTGNQIMECRTDAVTRDDARLKAGGGPSTHVRLKFSHASADRAYGRAVIGRQRAKDLPMNHPFGRAGGLRSRLFKLVLASAVACALPALAAETASASRVVLTPSIKGAGVISGSGSPSGLFYFCSNTNQNEAVVGGCPGGTFDGIFAPPFLDIPAVVTIVAAPSGVPTAGNWVFSRWFGCPSGDFNPTCTLSASGSQIRGFSPQAVFDDVRLPTVTSLSTFFSTTVDRGVSFGFSADESLSAITCQVDNVGDFLPCGNVRTLPEGTHTVRARGTDLSGQLGGISGTLATFRIVDTQLVSGPSDFSSVKRPTFTYSSLAGLKFECSVDNVVIATACGDKNPSTNRASFTQPTDLPDGLHTFRVEAIDGPDFDRVPIVRTWRVDTTAPVIAGLASPTITDGIVTTALNATFNWGVNEVGGLDRFECKLDGGAFAPCASGKTFNDLPFGGHTFTVRGVDKAGNVGPEVSRSWTVAARDEDGDGFNQRSDCNDGNPAINPIAPDVPDNGVDENCDGADAVNLDRDGDGFQRPGDCNDGNPSIRPGVPDILDNNIDENCDGSDAKSPPPSKIVISMPFFVSKSTNAFTTFTVLQVKGFPAGSTVKVSCKAPKGKKCPGGSSFSKKNATGTVSLKQWLKKKLPAGTKMTTTVTKPGNFIGAVKIMTIKKKSRPSFVDRCTKPGSTKAVGC
jgi:hypothetical protein